MEKLYNIHFSNANSRETYFTLHNVKKAHEYGKGKNIKVGIIDWCFGFDKYPELYAGGFDFSGMPHFLKENAEHGYWMACVLREIAPECEIYALNYLNGNNFNDISENFIKAINWACKNGIDILTYSSRSFNEKERPLVDAAVEIAVSKGIIPVFIHYDHASNLFPGPLFKYDNFKRPPDIRILHYDYNTLFIDTYQKYISIGKEKIDSGNDIPYFSMSSTSPVAAGFAAILKSIDSTLNINDIKNTLKETSFGTHFKGYARWENSYTENIADIGKAAEFVYRKKR